MAEAPRRDQLSDRSRGILKTLIREYVRTGKPVGSRRLSRIYPEKLSPATLRNEMADLEESGYLTQPHPSAGRMPSREGYRVYVASLLETRNMPPAELAEIQQYLAEEVDPEELMTKVSQLLSTYSNNIGIVLSPPISRVIMKHIEFVKLSDRRILVILASRTGLVQHRLIRLDENLDQSELDRASRYLVENFAGRSLSEIRSSLMRLLSEEKSLYNRLLQNVLILGTASLVQSEEAPSENPQVYLDGTSRVVQRLDQEEIDRIFSLLETFEQKNRLVKIISECVDEADHSPYVRIGLEDHIPELSNWTLIASPYYYGDQTRGSLGILGPSRMEYEKAISLVDYVATLFGQILERN